MKQTLPERGEIVLVKITRVLNYGAFAELIDYGGPHGFVHISQVASSWVKNIRNHVKENQVRAALVQNIDTAKNQIDLSLAKVSPRTEREAIEAWRAAKRSRKLIEVLAKRAKIKPEEAWREIAKPLEEAHGSVMEGLREIAVHGTNAAQRVPEKWHKPLEQLVKENIKTPARTLKGVFTIKVMEPDGVVRIRKAFETTEKKRGKATVAVSYEGGGKYALAATAPDFKTAGESLTQMRQEVENALKNANAKVSFEEAAGKQKTA